MEKNVWLLCLKTVWKHSYAKTITNKTLGRALDPRLTVLGKVN